MIVFASMALLWVGALAAWIMYCLENAKVQAKEARIKLLIEADKSHARQVHELQLEVKAKDKQIEEIQLKSSGKLAELRKKMAIFANDLSILASEG